MKKRILCLLLAVLTVLSCALVGCTQPEDGADDENLNSNVNTARAPKTLNMWVITEEETTEEAQKQVQAAFSAYTEETYTTKVNLIFATKDEYEAKLDAQFALTDSRPHNHSFKQSSEIETVIDPETGMTLMKYPDASQYQVDIVLITSKDMLNKYIAADYDSTNKEGRLKSLNTALNNASKIIRSYVYNILFDNAKVNGTWYAVPNNDLIGEYTFMMINREMADKYYFNESDFTNFADLNDRGEKTAVAKLIDAIAQNEDLSKIAPMLGMADYPLVEYWGENGAMTALASFYNAPNATLGYFPGLSTVFSDRNYNAYMNLMYYCKENGYFMTEGQESFGVGIMTGDYSTIAEYSDEYYVRVLDYPHLNDEAIFDSMFAVTKYTTDMDRAMEIITDLTCKSELRNILQYGVEGVHYDFNDDGEVVRNLEDANNIYKMNVSYTGNVLTAYPEKGITKENWVELVKQQNLQSVISVLCGSHDSLVNVDKNAMSQMLAVSKAYFERMESCKTALEFKEFAKAAATEISAAPYYKTLTNERLEDNSFDTASLKGAITKWYRDLFGIKDE